MRMLVLPARGSFGFRNLTSVRLQSFRNDCNQVETWLRATGRARPGFELRLQRQRPRHALRHVCPSGVPIRGLTNVCAGSAGTRRLVIGGRLREVRPYAQAARRVVDHENEPRPERPGADSSEVLAALDARERRRCGLRLREGPCLDCDRRRLR